MRSWRFDLDSDIHAPRFVRHTVRSWLTLVACPDDVKEDVLLFVSEVVTEGGLHGAQRVSVRVVTDDGRLRVDVHATGATPAAEGSFADRIGPVLADIWGRSDEPDGTHVWAEMLH